MMKRPREPIVNPPKKANPVIEGWSKKHNDYNVPKPQADVKDNVQMSARSPYEGMDMNSGSPASIHSNNSSYQQDLIRNEIRKNLSQSNYQPDQPYSETSEFAHSEWPTALNPFQNTSGSNVNPNLISIPFIDEPVASYQYNEEEGMEKLFKEEIRKSLNESDPVSPTAVSNMIKDEMMKSLPEDITTDKDMESPIYDPGSGLDHGGNSPVSCGSNATPQIGERANSALGNASDDNPQTAAIREKILKYLTPLDKKAQYKYADKIKAKYYAYKHNYLSEPGTKLGSQKKKRLYDAFSLVRVEYYTARDYLYHLKKSNQSKDAKPIQQEAKPIQQGSANMFNDDEDVPPSPYSPTDDAPYSPSEEVRLDVSTSSVEVIPNSSGEDKNKLSELVNIIMNNVKAEEELTETAEIHDLADEILSQAQETVDAPQKIPKSSNDEMRNPSPAVSIHSSADDDFEINTDALGISVYNSFLSNPNIIPAILNSDDPSAQTSQLPGKPPLPPVTPLQPLPGEPPLPPGPAPGSLPAPPKYAPLAPPPCPLFVFPGQAQQTKRNYPDDDSSSSDSSDNSNDENDEKAVNNLLSWKSSNDTIIKPALEQDDANFLASFGVIVPKEDITERPKPIVRQLFDVKEIAKNIQENTEIKVISAAMQNEMNIFATVSNLYPLDSYE